MAEFPNYADFENLEVDQDMLFDSMTCVQKAPWIMDDIFKFLSTNIAFVSEQGIYLMKLFDPVTQKYKHHRKTKSGMLDILGQYSFPVVGSRPYNGGSFLKTGVFVQYCSLVFDPSSPNPKTNEIKNTYLQPRMRPYNTFKGLAYKFDPGRLLQTTDGATMFEGHAFNVLCDGNADIFHYLMLWVGHMFQFPEVKSGSAILMRSIQGIGKNLWWDVISAILGSSYTGYITHKQHLEGNFNAHLENKLLVVCDEMGLGSNREIANLMKARITQQVSMLERKGQDAVVMKSYERYVWLSNEKWPVRVEQSDRRWACIQGTSNIHTMAYYQNFARFYENPNNIQSVCDYFVTMKDVTRSLPLPPKTDLWHELREMAQPDEIMFLKDMVNGAEGMPIDVIPDASFVTATGMHTLY